MLDNIFQQKKYDESATTMTSEFFVNVYSYMFIALGISGSIAYLAGTPEFVETYFINVVNGIPKISGLFYIVAFAPLILGLVIQWAYTKLSMSLLMILFAIFSALMGLSLSTIFLVYDLSSIFTTFAVTSLSFGAMAILGYTTKTDLTKMGSLLYMVFAGIVIASIVNFFMGNDMVDLVISILGVFVFTGLTAYEMQKLKYIAQDPELGHFNRRKLSLIGGLRLYILFINLFISLLRLVGSRD